MEIYKYDRLCPKCGQSKIRDAFRGKGERISYAMFKMDSAREDLIRRNCQNCGWQWNERPHNSSDK